MFEGGGPSEATSQYIKGIKEAGERIQKVGAGLQAVKSEIRRREEVARSSVKESNVALQGKTFADQNNKTANEMKANIGGEGEKAYDFSRVADIERFKNDVSELNRRIEKAEAVHSETMGTAEDGPDKNTWHGMMARRKLAQASGNDASQGHVYEDLAGDGDFYDAGAASDEASAEALALMDESEITENADGTFTIKTPTKEIVVNSYDEALEVERKSVLPQYDRMPDLSGAQMVRDKSIGPNKYVTADQAASAYVQEVMSPKTKAAAERFAQKRTGTRERLQTTLSTASRNKLMDYYGINAPEDFTEEQFQYFEEMMQEWHDEVDVLKRRDDEEARTKRNRGSGGAKTDDLIGRIDSISYSMNENSQNSRPGADQNPENMSTVAGEGVALGNQAIQLGEISGGKAKQFIYNNDTGEYFVVIHNDVGQEHVVEVAYGGDDLGGARGALAGALGVSIDNLRQLMAEMRKKAIERANR